MAAVQHEWMVEEVHTIEKAYGQKVLLQNVLIDDFILYSVQYEYTERANATELWWTNELHADRIPAVSLLEILLD